MNWIVNEYYLLLLSALIILYLGMYILKKTITEKEFQFTIRDKQAKTLHLNMHTILNTKLYKIKSPLSKNPSLSEIITHNFNPIKTSKPYFFLQLNYLTKVNTSTVKHLNNKKPNHLYFLVVPFLVLPPNLTNNNSIIVPHSKYSKLLPTMPPLTALLQLIWLLDVVWSTPLTSQLLWPEIVTLCNQKWNNTVKLIPLVYYIATYYIKKTVPSIVPSSFSFITHTKNMNIFFF